MPSSFIRILSSCVLFVNSVMATSPEKTAVYSERRSRIHSLINQRESGDGMDAAELANTEHKLVRTSQLMSNFQDSGDDMEDE